MSRSPLGGGKHQCWNWTKWTLDWLMRIGDGSEFYFLYQEQKKQWQHSGGFIGGKSFLVAFHNWSCCQIFQTSRYQICALAVSCKWPGVHDQTMSKKLFLFVEGSLSFCRGSTRQNFVQFYQTSKKPRQKKSPRSSPIFLCVCLLRTEPYASPWTCVQVSFSFQKGTKLKSTRIKHGQKLKEKILLGFLTKISVMLKEFGNLINVSGMKKDCHICSATVITEEEFFTEIRQKNFVA